MNILYQVENKVRLGVIYGVLRYSQQYFSYIVYDLKT